MKTAQVINLLNSGSKNLSFHVLDAVGIRSGRTVFEQGLDYAADLKAVSYLNAYRAQFNKYPSCVRFVYKEKDICIVDKNGNTIL